ncbi:hypothetical protein NMY22_g15566 [Coprinellus aureogranulatus]|nr:hypothetical protein NMY22_g15566 [Coprinellus aureogranulatus]
MPTSHHPHGTTAYAPPVTVRAPSPASSIGTLYSDDATSDHELRMSEVEFARFCEEKIKLNHPRPEEERAQREPLIRDPARGKGGDAEHALYERIVASLRAEIKRLEDEEIFERALRKGSQIGLEQQPPTSDIDKIMRSMMGPGFSLALAASGSGSGPTAAGATSTTSNAATRTSTTATEFQQQTQPTQLVPTQPADVAPGPWNNYGKKPASLKTRSFPSLGLAQLTSSSGNTSNTAPTTAAPSLISTTTSAAAATDTNTDSTNTLQVPADPLPEDAMNIDDHDHGPGLSLLSPGSSGGLRAEWVDDVDVPAATMVCTLS